MDIQNTRRIRLLALIDEYGSMAKMIKKTGINQSYLSQIKNGKVPFGEKIARDIEKKTKKPPRWLDGEEFAAPGENEQKYKTILGFVLRMVQAHQIEQQQFYTPEVFEKTVQAILDLLMLTTKNQDAVDSLDDEDITKLIIKLLPNL